MILLRSGQTDRHPTRSVTDPDFSPYFVPLPIAMMSANLFTELFPFSFSVNPLVVSGATLWALALYLAFSPVSDWVMRQLTRWFNFAERALYLSQEEFEKTRVGRESQNAFWASLFSIVPFIALGTLIHYGVNFGLGDSWSISLGLLCAVGSGVYELGRRDSQASDSD